MVIGNKGTNFILNLPDRKLIAFKDFESNIFLKIRNDVSSFQLFIMNLDLF
jgi:hypothetical protein